MMGDKENGVIVLEDKLEDLVPSVKDNNKIYKLYKGNM